MEPIRTPRTRWGRRRSDSDICLLIALAKRLIRRAAPRGARVVRADARLLVPDRAPLSAPRRALATDTGAAPLLAPRRRRQLGGDCAAAPRRDRGPLRARARGALGAAGQELDQHSPGARMSGGHESRV